MAGTLALLSMASNNELSSLRAGSAATTVVNGSTDRGTSGTTTISASARPTATGLDGEGDTNGTGAPGATAADGAGGSSATDNTDGSAGAGTGSGALAPGVTTGGVSTTARNPTATLAGAGTLAAPTSAGAPDTAGANGDPVSTVSAGSGDGSASGGSTTAAEGGTGTDTAAPDATANGGTGAATAADGGSNLGSTLRKAFTAVALALSATGVAYLAGSLLQTILQLRRRDADADSPDDLDDPLQPIVIDPTVAGWTLERLRGELEAEPDPRLAVRHAYAVVESGFGAGGGLARRRTETPLEYIERTLGVIEGATQPLRVLTGLFLLARFSNRPMNEAMRRAAIDAVVELQARYRQAEQVAA